jgi:hypothetical protein
MRQRAFLRHEVAPAPRVRPGSLLRVIPVLALSSVLASVAACRDRAPDAVTFARLGLGLTHPAYLELPMPVSVELPIGRAGSAFARRSATAPASAPDSLRAQIAPPSTGASAAVLVPYHVELRARHLPALRLEICIDHRPPQPRMTLALARSLRHGASLVIDDVRAEQIAGRPWQRTRFSHAARPGPLAKPSIGIEYAAVSGAHLYRVTAYGPAGDVDALAERVAPTLRLDGGGDPPLWPIAGSPPGTPAAVERAAAAVVVVVAADIDMGDAAAGEPVSIRPTATGSGIAVDAEGNVLTSAHTLHDEQRDILHDLFLIGQERAGVLVFVCAGRPAQAELERDLDLALIRCTLDLSGGAFAPADWPALATAAAPMPGPGDRIWVLGRAATGDGALEARPGRVLGASSPDPGAAGPALITIDVPVVHGMSGGAVVDADGALLGVVHGFRERFQADLAGVRRTGRFGLMRPITHAQALLEIRRRLRSPRQSTGMTR